MHGIEGKLGMLAAQLEAVRTQYPYATATAAIASMTLWIVCFLPTTIPEFTIGFLFGLREGYIVTMTAKVIGCGLSYMLGRSVLRSLVRRVLGAQGHGGELLDVFEREASERPYRTALLLRAAYLPMPLKNYGPAVIGLQAVSFCAVFLPVELIDTYPLMALGASAKDLAALLRGELPEGSESASHAWAHLAWIGVTICCSVILLCFIASAVRQIIQGRLNAAGKVLT